MSSAIALGGGRLCGSAAVVDALVDGPGSSVAASLPAGWAWPWAGRCVCCWLWFFLGFVALDLVGGLPWELIFILSILYWVVTRI